MMTTYIIVSSILAGAVILALILEHLEEKKRYKQRIEAIRYWQKLAELKEKEKKNKKNE